ncbi:hypothetical protein A584_29096 [Pseudomonas syringae pv. theae ICMP 3923]|nr:hypothetical protein A584_29096 [Pseudomonas syringae pv. theae ICMP 3923]
MSYPVCLGDATSSGGQVVSCQLAGTHTINGKPLAVLGDKATCPLHSGEFAFIEGHPTRKMNVRLSGCGQPRHECTSGLGVYS